MSAPSPELCDLVARAGRGDAAAQEQLVRTYYEPVRARVHDKLAFDFRKNHRWIVPLFSTGDIVQEVFRGVIGNLGTVDIDGEDALLRYLTTVVHNRIQDAVRYHEAERRDSRRVREQPTQGLQLPATGDPTPLDAAHLAEQLRILRETLDGFPERQRLVLELRLLDEEPFAVVADKLGYASAATARQAFVEAHARLLVKMRARGVR